MRSITDPYQLSNGVTVPCVGFGTWKSPEGEETVTLVQNAIEAGYRHFDTAAVYNNERSVGQALARSGLAREEIFVATKLQNVAHSYQKALDAFEQSREKLGLAYVDLYLIHWPSPIEFRDQWKEANASTWKALEELYRQGKIRAIGVSNFRRHHLEALLETAEIAPMVNQLRLCPGDTHADTVAFCQKTNILPEAYSPLGTGQILQVPEMCSLAEKYGKTVAQICLRWHLQSGHLPLPHSVRPERMRENAALFDFALTEQDMSLISGLEGCVGYATDPDTSAHHQSEVLD